MIKKNKDIILFGDFRKKFQGNSKFLSQYIKDNFKNKKIYFVVKDIKKEKKEKGIIYLDYKKNFYKILKIILISKYIFISGSHLDITKGYFFGNFKIINLWHGLPIKRFYFSNINNNNKFSFSKIIGTFIFSQYYFILSPSKNFEKVFRECFNTNNFKSFGQPRADFFLKKEINKKDIKKKIGLNDINYKKIFFFCPTYRTEKEVNFFTQENLIKLNLFLKKNNFVFLIKNHPSRKNVLKENYSNIKDITNNYLSSEEILPIANILISDYSSIVYDFLIYKKPIILYHFDVSEYKKKVGIFEEILKKHLKMKVTNSFKELFEELKNFKKIKKTDISTSLKFAYGDNLGNSCYNICEYLKIE